MNKWAQKGQEQAAAVVRPAKAPAAVSVPNEKQACFGCGSTTRKLGPVPGTKTMVGCASCIRERKKAKRVQGRERRQQKVFGISLAEEASIIEFQGGGCICIPWTGYNGNTRSLSTDHDHRTGEVRGKLCKHCNDLLGRIRDNPEFLRRMIAYLENPPAIRLLGSRIVPGFIPPGEE